MNNLTNEQIQRIEDNKRAAQLKRQQAIATTSVEPMPNNKAPLTNNKHIAYNNVKVLKNKTKSNGNSRKHGYSIEQSSYGCGVQSRNEVGSCYLIKNNRFAIKMAFNEPVVNILKTIQGRCYDNSTKEWNFPLSQHVNVISKLSAEKFTLRPLPVNILNIFATPEPEYKSIDISKIDQALLRVLLPFQEEGIRFGVSRKGRCMIADDMGLGKTLQGMGIANYFKEKWPLLIVCPSSMRFPWEEAFHRFLPSISPFSIVVITAADDDIHEANVVIISYDLLKTYVENFKRKKFGVLIFDESHFLKNMKSGRSKAALELTPLAHHVILLSGTPALSRPLELYSQIFAIDPNCFKYFIEYGKRYCDGKKNRFGWDFSGSSNLTELELFLKRQFMIRRLKADVLSQLPGKVRKVVMLQPKLVSSVLKQLKTYAGLLETQSGLEKRRTLFQYYYLTGSAKLPAVREYLLDKLENSNKMLIFAYHTHVMDSICELLFDKKVDYIRIDGSTSSEKRLQLCEQFQTDLATRVAVLSLKAANSGITLTAANLVLFAEIWWNPGELTQAEDRAHRIGQNENVSVEYLLAKNTVDDKLWSMIQSKLNVLNDIGLSKDNFKNSDTEHLKDKTVKKLEEFFETCSTSDNSESEKESKLPTGFLTNLSVDSSDMELLENKTVTAFDTFCETTSKSDINRLEKDTKLPTDFLTDSIIEKEFSEEAFVDDEIFDCVDLESIETIANLEPKRFKLS